MAFEIDEGVEVAGKFGGGHLATVACLCNTDGAIMIDLNTIVCTPFIDNGKSIWSPWNSLIRATKHAFELVLEVAAVAWSKGFELDVDVEEYSNDIFEIVESDADVCLKFGFAMGCICAYFEVEMFEVQHVAIVD